MEVIIAVIMLSTVMVTLLQIKSDNIFVMSSSNEKTIKKDYLSLAVNLNPSSTRNENIFLDRLYSFENDDLRKELKKIKIKIKDKKLDTQSFEYENKNFTMTTYSTSYSLNDDIKKEIYSFKLEL